MVVLGALCVLYSSASAGQYVRVSPDLELYYEEAGAGTPLLLIPGLAGTTDVYAPQMAHFSTRYRTITYDPRGQGRSSKTLENHHYPQHGADLKAFMEALKLTEVIVVGHSNGCFDLYAYVRAYGTEHLKAAVCIDRVPKDIWTQDGDDWTRVKNAVDLRPAYMAFAYNRRKAMPTVLQSMVTRELTKDETTFWVDKVMQTPDYVATLLLMDARFADYTEEVKRLDATRPFLYVLAEDTAEKGLAWIKKHLPKTETFVLGKHLMLWEFPEKFNTAVEAFLAKVK
jgi:pimeloyl-ACP methyl ester carboxylesterase